jgi:hypothetical protein
VALEYYVDNVSTFDQFNTMGVVMLGEEELSDTMEGSASIQRIFRTTMLMHI